MKNLLSIEIISKYDWYIHKGVLPESDIFMFELDKSYYNGILHFSHELTLLFTFVDNKLEFIGGSDIGPEYVEYKKRDWEWVKERYSLSDEFILAEIVRKTASS